MNKKSTKTVNKLRTLLISLLPEYEVEIRNATKGQLELMFNKINQSGGVSPPSSYIDLANFIFKKYNINPNTYSGLFDDAVDLGPIWFPFSNFTENHASIIRNTLDVLIKDKRLSEIVKQSLNKSSGSLNTLTRYNPDDLLMLQFDVIIDPAKISKELLQAMPIGTYINRRDNTEFTFNGNNHIIIGLYPTPDDLAEILYHYKNYINFDKIKGWFPGSENNYINLLNKIGIN